MSLAKRIIPCLDVDRGRVVKGVKFVDIKDAGDPVEVAKRYNDEGADEITFLDITASHEQRETILNVVEKVANQVFIPLTVGGGVKDVADIRRLLDAGADKIAINSSAVSNPQLIQSASKKFGAQCIVVAIDAKNNNDKDQPQWYVYTHGGRVKTDITVLDWAKKIEQYGAGELLLTSMDKDGTKSGFDLQLTRMVSMNVSIPIIASGGVGNLEHLVEGIRDGFADAVLAASIFHFNQFTISQAKHYLQENGICVRI